MRALAIAQASTQFVGLANACTYPITSSPDHRPVLTWDIVVYGYNERIWGLAKLWWRSKPRKARRSETERGTTEIEDHRQTAGIYIRTVSGWWKLDEQSVQ